MARDLPPYATLGTFVAQEIPYTLQDGQDENGENVEFLDPLLEEGFDDGKGSIERVGWLAEHSKRLPPGSASPPGEPPSPIEDDQMTSEMQGECYRLQRVKDGAYLTDSDGVTPLQITKVIKIPYRWRREGQAREEARQTYLLVAYNGPSAH
jgi:hypothetical protein